MAFLGCVEDDSSGGGCTFLTCAEVDEEQGLTLEAEYSAGASGYRSSAQQRVCSARGRAGEQVKGDVAVHV